MNFRLCRDRYFGGRSEVRWRKTVRQVVHTDFLSMYPTVCTLMGLWRFVTGEGFTASDQTVAVRSFLDTVTADHLQDPKIWPKLTALVRVKPDNELFPLRVCYQGDDHPTIGLNYLTSDDQVWVTLADCIAPKLLSGKTPEIIEAIGFEAVAEGTKRADDRRHLSACSLLPLVQHEAVGLESLVRIATAAPSDPFAVKAVELIGVELVERNDFRKYVRALTELLGDLAWALEETQPSFEEDVRAWRELFRDIQGVVSRTAPLDTFLQELELRSKEPPLKPGVVPLLTIHGSKGNEFPHVYLMGLAEDILPSFQSRQRGERSP